MRSRQYHMAIVGATGAVGQEMLAILEESKFPIVKAAQDHFRRSHDVIDVDGVRVLFGDGWGLLRASNTQPVIVARYEARTPERLAEIRHHMESWLQAQGVHV